jgi:hypothetical protein
MIRRPSPPASTASQRLRLRIPPRRRSPEGARGCPPGRFLIRLRSVSVRAAGQLVEKWRASWRPSGRPDGLPDERATYLHPAGLLVRPVCWSALGGILTRGGPFEFGTGTAQGVHSV